MAEFSEVMKQFDRLCVSSSCPGCPLEGNCDMAYARDYPQVFEERVMEWAKAHPPGPVYPTWGDWLDHSNQLLHNRIPAGIAKKLGIKPREG